MANVVRCYLDFEQPPYVLRAREREYLYWESRNEARGKFDEVDLARFRGALEREEVADNDDENQVSCIASEIVAVNNESCRQSIKFDSPTENNAI